MTTSALEGLTSRPLARSDLDATVDLWVAAETRDVGEPLVERADIESDWNTPGSDLDADTLGVFDGERLAGAAEVRRGATRVEAAVHPDYRGRGIGSALAAWSEDEARRRGVARVGQSVLAGSPADRLLSGRGYTLGWDSWVLGLPAGRAVPPRELPSGYRLHTADDAGDLQGAYGVIHDAFGEWSERDDETFATWAVHVVQRTGFEPWQLRVVSHGQDGVVGACYTRVDATGCAYVGQLAVARGHRGRGLAQALLADGFRNGAEHGATRSELNTDSRTGALGVYEKVGMEVTSTWRHLVLDL